MRLERLAVCAPRIAQSGEKPVQIARVRHKTGRSEQIDSQHAVPQASNLRTETDLRRLWCGGPAAGEFCEPVLYDGDARHRPVGVGNASCGNESLAVADNRVAQSQVNRNRIAFEHFARFVHADRCTRGDVDFHQLVAKGPKPKLVAFRAPSRESAANRHLPLSRARRKRPEVHLEAPGFV